MDDDGDVDDGLLFLAIRACCDGSYKYYNRLCEVNSFGYICCTTMTSPLFARRTSRGGSMGAAVRLACDRLVFAVDRLRPLDRCLWLFPKKTRNRQASIIYRPFMWYILIVIWGSILVCSSFKK